MKKNYYPTYLYEVEFVYYEGRFFYAYESRYYNAELKHCYYRNIDDIKKANRALAKAVKFLRRHGEDVSIKVEQASNKITYRTLHFCKTWRAR